MNEKSETEQKDSNRNELKLKALVELAGSYNREYSKPVLKRMLKAVDAMTVGELEDVIDIVIRTNEYPPSMATLWEVVNSKRDMIKDRRAKRVISWLMKNTAWDYSMEAHEGDVEKALKELGLPPGCVEASDI